MERYEEGRRLLAALREHVLETLPTLPNCDSRGAGARNVLVERQAGLELGLDRQDHWLTWSILRVLEREKRVERIGNPSRWRLRRGDREKAAQPEFTGTEGRGVFSSSELRIGSVYSRRQLAAKWGIKDATIKNGVFAPKGHRSIWLFVTEDKTQDRTPYEDRFEGQTLSWQGQLSGRTDALIINHRQKGMELVVFRRRDRQEYPGAAFRYAGVYRYQTHYPTKPTTFLLGAEEDADEGGDRQGP